MRDERRATDAAAGSWEEWSRYVLMTLDSLTKAQEALERDIVAARVEIGMLKVRAGFWGAIVGGLISAATVISVALLKN